MMMVTVVGVVQPRLGSAVAVSVPMTKPGGCLGIEATFTARVETGEAL
jgi:hypothetical protein